VINKYIIIWNLKYNFYLKYNSYLKICTINQFLFFLFFFCFVVKNRNTSKRRRKAINIFNKWRGLSWHDFLLFWNNLKAMHQSISLLMLSHSLNVFQNIGKKKKKGRRRLKALSLILDLPATDFWPPLSTDMACTKSLISLYWDLSEECFSSTFPSPSSLYTCK
jgi:hypothetical protein